MLVSNTVYIITARVKFYLYKPEGDLPWSSANCKHAGHMHTDPGSQSLESSSTVAFFSPGFTHNLWQFWWQIEAEWHWRNTPWSVRFTCEDQLCELTSFISFDCHRTYLFCILLLIQSEPADSQLCSPKSWVAKQTTHGGWLGGLYYLWVVRIIMPWSEIRIKH